MRYQIAKHTPFESFFIRNVIYFSLQKDLEQIWFLFANCREWLRSCLSTLFSNSLHFLSKFRRKRRSSQYFGGQDLWLVGRVAGGGWPGEFVWPQDGLKSISICIQTWFICYSSGGTQQEPPFSSSWGLVSVTSKPSIFSFSESCHLSRVYQMALLTRNKARAQPHPAGVSRDHNRVDSFIFSALTCPGTKHILSQRSPQVEQR